MIKQLTLYTVICDECGKDAFNNDDQSGASNEQLAIEISKDYEFVEIDGKHYCLDCYWYDTLTDTFKTYL